MLFARLFSPADLGLANLAFGCISFLVIFANFGFPQSIIRDREKSLAGLNTIFTLSMGFSLVILILTLLTAPLFSSVFSENLSPLIRLLAILAFSIPMRFPIYLWEKELKFGNPAVATVISEGCMFLFTILVEILFHLGVWSLLIGNLSGFLLTGLYVWITSKYRPRIQIDKIQVKNLLGFGAPLMVQGLNGEVMARGDNLMVGAYAGTSQLAFYNFAWQMPTMISQFTQTIDSMLLPVFVKIKEDTTSTNRLF